MLLVIIPWIAWFHPFIHISFLKVCKFIRTIMVYYGNQVSLHFGDQSSEYFIIMVYPWWETMSKLWESSMPSFFGVPYFKMVGDNCIPMMVTSICMMRTSYVFIIGITVYPRWDPISALLGLARFIMGTSLLNIRLYTCFHNGNQYL